MISLNCKKLKAKGEMRHLLKGKYIFKDEILGLTSTDKAFILCEKLLMMVLLLKFIIKCLIKNYLKNWVLLCPFSLILSSKKVL